MKKKLSLSIILAGLLAQGTAFADEAVVAVANNFYGPMKELAQDFHAAVPEHTMRISTGSTGQLYSQIENGAPFDLFFAADTVRPEKLIAEGNAVNEFTYAKGALVLWSENPDMDVKAALDNSNYNHIAMANPKLAPYGLAAEQALEKMKMYDAIQAKVVLGKGLNPTYQFVKTGNAELGFVAKSQVFKGGKYNKGAFWEVPKSDYAEIKQDAVTLKSGETNAAAKAFLAYYKTDRAQKIVKSYGYL